MHGLRNYAVDETTSDDGAGSDVGTHAGGDPGRPRVAFREWEHEGTGEEETGEEEDARPDAQETEARISGLARDCLARAARGL